MNKRAKLLASAQPRKVPFEYEGEQFELLELTAGQANQSFLISEEKGSTDYLAYITACSLCDAGVKMFDQNNETDLEELKGTRPGFLSAVGNAIGEAFGEKLEDTEKN